MSKSTKMKRELHIAAVFALIVALIVMATVVTLFLDRQLSMDEVDANCSGYDYEILRDAMNFRELRSCMMDYGAVMYDSQTNEVKCERIE